MFVQLLHAAFSDENFRIQLCSSSQDFNTGIARRAVSLRSRNFLMFRVAVWCLCTAFKRLWSYDPMALYKYLYYYYYYCKHAAYCRVHIFQMDVNCHKPDELRKTVQLQNDRIQQVCNKHSCSTQNALTAYLMCNLLVRRRKTWSNSTKNLLLLQDPWQRYWLLAELNNQTSKPSAYKCVNRLRAVDGMLTAVTCRRRHSTAVDGRFAP